MGSSMVNDRILRFQERMRSRGIDASMIRTLSSFTYFSGTKWLRPALLIPAEGEPVAFIFREEAEEFSRVSSVKEIKTFGGIDELIGEISGAIRRSGYSKVGFDMSVERDSYELFYHMFRNFTPQAEIVDVHHDIMALRMIKDSGEIDAISKAGGISDIGMKAAEEAISIGASETDIAAEATYAMMKEGSEAPHVYVNAGPHPRLHAEPRKDARVANGDVVSVTVSGDFGAYYCNESRTFLAGTSSARKKRALETGFKLYSVAVENMMPGNVFNSVEAEIEKAVKDTEFASGYEKGFSHGVGLLVEEDPITTILIPERRLAIAENMVLAAVHTPLSLRDIGAVKFEDTFLVGKEGPKRLTCYEIRS